MRCEKNDMCMDILNTATLADESQEGRTDGDRIVRHRPSPI